MRRYVLRRVLSLVPLLLAVSIVIFVALAVAPGDPAVLMLGQDATPEGVRELRQILGLDLPLPVQYARFVGGALRGDLGRSFQTRRPVAGELMRTFQVTLALTITALSASCLVGLAVGILSAMRPRSLIDYLVRVVILTSVSMPI
ncbi:MAG: ABC transporter permease, partial [Armatimonadetes bacterium]|nr:ABC transporter permease [Armatimonadota bacterium]